MHRSGPIELPPCPWRLPDPAGVEPGEELIGIGADLEPATLLSAYSNGIFPMPLSEHLRDAVGGLPMIGWWSPDPRAIIPLDGLHVSRTLRRSMRSFDIRINTAFDDVVEACADPSRPHGWIDESFMIAYHRMYELGWAHSVETWDVKSNTLVGGLFGLSIGAFFAAESKFHRKTDASKAAVVGLVEHLRTTDHALLDVQWLTPHLASLGATEIGRTSYLQRLSQAVDERTRKVVQFQHGRDVAER